jgi:hypothetical protein
VTYSDHDATIPDEVRFIQKYCGTAGFDARIAAPMIANSWMSLRCDYANADDVQTSTQQINKSAAS